MNYLWLADLVVSVHLAYAGFVLFGFLAIVLSPVLRWTWPLNPAFRMLHLACIALVAAESVCGTTCPLTILENYLLRAGGRAGYERSFIGEWMNGALFYDAPEEVFTVLYGLLAVVALLAYRHPLRRPPHPSRNSRNPTAPGSLKRLWRL